MKYAMSIRRLEIKNLTKDRQSLVELARRAALSAYAPYSGFKVGAAVLMSDGTVYTGNNQENAAYGQSVCAERVALLYAQAQKPGVAPEAVAALATVTEKAREPAILALAESLSLPLRHFPAPVLATVPTPTPSVAAGKRFGLPPFSVCEAAALLAADASDLLVPKTAMRGCLTFALAVAKEGSPIG